MLDYKQVIVLDENLPTGVMANAIAALSVSIGKLHPELVGYDMEDHTGHLRQGITCVGIPILKGGNKLGDMREALKAYEDELTVIDLISATSTTKTYDEYAACLKNTPTNQLNYYALLLYGKKKIINKFTGSLGLLK